jgi:hypothetical protein
VHVWKGGPTTHQKTSCDVLPSKGGVTSPRGREGLSEVSG